MKHRILCLASALFVLSLTTAMFVDSAALATCKGDVPDGKCEPPGDDCSCDDCLAACSGECTVSNPACTLEDSCTCKECWTNVVCTDPSKKNCKDDGTCDFFTEGCCCADCVGQSSCKGFNGDCGMGTGGTGGSGAAGGSGGSGAVGGTGGSGGMGGSGGATGGSGGSGGKGTGGGLLNVPKSGCACSAAGAQETTQLGVGVALALVALSRKRRRR